MPSPPSMLSVPKPAERWGTMQIRALPFQDVSIPALHQRSRSEPPKPKLHTLTASLAFSVLCGGPSRISLKMRPSTATQVFNALAKMEETLFEELGSEVASVESLSLRSASGARASGFSCAGADFKREFCTMRERAVASLGEWQSFVEDWKTSLLTRPEGKAKSPS